MDEQPRPEHFDLLHTAEDPFAPLEFDAMKMYYDDPSMKNQDTLLQVLSMAGAARKPRSYMNGGGNA